MEAEIVIAVAVFVRCLFAREPLSVSVASFLPSLFPPADGIYARRGVHSQVA